MKNVSFILALSLFAASCKVAEGPITLGSIERADPSLDAIIDPGAIIEVLSDGYVWCEGPLWVEEHEMLLFSDVPTNTVYQWTDQDSVAVYLKPSGYTGGAPSNSAEEGSNGLALNAERRLVLCQHGDRRLALMDAPLDDPESSFTTVAGQYQGKRFNSPNDVAIRSNGDYFFTDPPYGHPKGLAQELPFQGVYKVSEGEVTLLVDSLTRPNGIALTPDERTLIIANSDPNRVMWYAYDLGENDTLINGRIFYDGTQAAKNAKGMPDGLKIDRNGNVFASGPGGVWIFNSGGKVLGKIQLPVATANCALSTDEKMLFITADNYLLRVRMRD